MRVLISGGGTGGHVYPALAVADRLARMTPSGDVSTDDPLRSRSVQLVRDEDAAQVGLLWIGSIGGMEQALVERHGIAYRGIETGQLHGMDPIRAIVNVGKMSIGVRQGLAEVGRFQPHVCLATGGYVCAPVIAACRWRRVPVLIYLPDMTPGWSIRWLSRLADRVAVTAPDAADAFGGEAPAGKAVVTGYPVRKELEAPLDRATARAELASALRRPLAEQGVPLVLSVGGSQGARSINRAMWAALPELLPYAHVLHIVGERDWGMVRGWARQQPIETRVEPALVDRYHPTAYLHDEMALALMAADIAVARAGASVLGEFPAARLPSILAPLPFGGVNQQRNAQELASRGAAVIVDDSKLESDLAPTLVGLLRDRERLAAMERAVANLARPAASQCIADELRALALRFSLFPVL